MSLELRNCFPYVRTYDATNLGQFLSPVIYDDITEDTIRTAALRTNGAAGVSCLDSDEWRKIIGSNIYGNAAVDLRK